MASVAKTRIIDNVTVVGVYTSAAVSIGPLTKKFMGFAKLESDNGGGSYAVKIQHSPNGIDWFDLITHGVITAVTPADLHVLNSGTTNDDFPVMGNIRAKVTQTGGVSAVISVDLFYENYK